VCACELGAFEFVTKPVNFASVADALGYTEATIAALLGQRSGNVTRRYIHHLDSALIGAADRVSALIQDSMDQQASSDALTTEAAEN
jgi:hypothetical protein